MEHFVTYFDKNYLPQGLVLADSLRRHVKHINLWVVCLDRATFTILEDLNLDFIKIIDVSEIETKELLDVKGTRKLNEYYWTLTPFIPSYILASNPEIERVCYLDADMWIVKPIDQLFLEFENTSAAVLITKHAYAPEHDATFYAGNFCVQAMVFGRQALEEILPSWRKDCLDWCHDYYEDGKFGDQKYLDYWPSTHKGVHILRNEHFILAPWNLTRIPYSDSSMMHFHGFKIKAYRNEKLYYTMSEYPLPLCVREHVYIPYAREIKAKFIDLKKYNLSFPRKSWVKDFFLLFWRKINKVISGISRGIRVWNKV